MREPSGRSSRGNPPRSRRSRSRSQERRYTTQKGKRKEEASDSASDYSYSYSYSYSDYSSSSRESSPIRRSRTGKSSRLGEEPKRRRYQTTELPTIDKDARPIRERLPLPDLGMMKRMMTSIHKSNTIADYKEKSASQKKLEVVIGRWTQR